MKVQKNYVIAIDGPCATGKSTLAKKIAKALNITYVDTGAMYRAVGLYFLNNNIELNEQNIQKNLDSIDIDIYYIEKSVMKITLNGKDVTDLIRTSQVSKYASEVSKYQKVREKLVSMQQRLGQNKSIVLEGRDIGTVVFPNADIKLYLTASYDVRAKRRQKDLIQKNENLDLEEIKKQLKQRDYNDMNRKYSPLRKAKDAITIDTTNLSKDDELEVVLDVITKKLNKIEI